MQINTVLITGGTGSWGRALATKLLCSGVTEIRLMARHEESLVAIAQEYSDPRVRPCVGDVRDAARLLELSRGCDTIFHLAALKHVPVCETAPTEALATNVEGTCNVITAAIANGVSRVVYSSTDKAVTPECAYGATKLLGEKLMQAAQQTAVNTRFITLRSGNLLGSSGSVLPLFRRQIAQRGTVTLTHAEMARFFLPIEHAAQLLIEAAMRGAGGEVFLPIMSSLRIANLARYLLEQAGLDQSGIEICGMRPGEKLYEQMATTEETRHIYRLSSDLAVIAKEDRHGWLQNSFVKPFSDYTVSSGDSPLDYAQTATLLDGMV